ncbi:hypothetical protein PICMEDRAFT_176344 [Pichia membranifaciens NRRL Y-2026]|uniref:Uncharacterized protein n=1 Tax=Pichia membranifaciens NRRL Y-2026 TaxID=763406 RepID=A0A1E3NF71_9ASCO|nr:hypothetical protein PICMEDRAFT_176344 [Pichia membranifaciens NRRL Y-2026]ODQ44769.1 hypothetical protein PICMEDRAFT_176344 [Pichia membranifaciens NRRL Y-2026]
MFRCSVLHGLHGLQGLDKRPLAVLGPAEGATDVGVDSAGGGDAAEHKGRGVVDVEKVNAGAGKCHADDTDVGGRQGGPAQRGRSTLDRHTPVRVVGQPVQQLASHGAGHVVADEMFALAGRKRAHDVARGGVLLEPAAAADDAGAAHACPVPQQVAAGRRAGGHQCPAPPGPRPPLQQKHPHRVLHSGLVALDPCVQPRHRRRHKRVVPLEPAHRHHRRHHPGVHGLPSPARHNTHGVRQREPGRVAHHTPDGVRRGPLPALPVLNTQVHHARVTPHTPVRTHTRPVARVRQLRRLQHPPDLREPLQVALLRRLLVAELHLPQRLLHQPHILRPSSRHVAAGPRVHHDDPLHRRRSIHSIPFHPDPDHLQHPLPS